MSGLVKEKKFIGIQNKPATGTTGTNIKIDTIDGPNVKYTRFYNTGGDRTGMSDGVWYKPSGITMVYIECIGAGGGGGNAYSGGSAAGAGAGGAFARQLFPAESLPDSLAVVVGTGGEEGASGSAGGLSKVTDTSTSPDKIILQAFGGGGGGTGSAGESATSGVTGIYKKGGSPWIQNHNQYIGDAIGGKGASGQFSGGGKKAEYGGGGGADGGTNSSGGGSEGGGSIYGAGGGGGGGDHNGVGGNGGRWGFYISGGAKLIPGNTGALNQGSGGGTGAAGGNGISRLYGCGDGGGGGEGDDGGGSTGGAGGWGGSPGGGGGGGGGADGAGSGGQGAAGAVRIWAW